MAAMSMMIMIMMMMSLTVMIMMAMMKMAMMIRMMKTMVVIKMTLTKADFLKPQSSRPLGFCYRKLTSYAVKLIVKAYMRAFMSA